MKVEILFSKLCNLYGDSKNIDYLKKSLPQAEFIMTEITDDAPYFKDHSADMLYIGSMTRNAQKRVIEKLMPLRERILSLIDSGTVFLATGNAFEVFTKSIENVTTHEKYDALGIFELETKIDLFHRFNGKVIGEVEGIKVLGFKSQFSMVYGDNSNEAFFRTVNGIGINEKSSFEGVRRRNFIGTHILGPILPLNPLFTEYIMKLAGEEDPRCAFREEAMAAYEKRLREFESGNIPFNRN